MAVQAPRGLRASRPGRALQAKKREGELATKVSSMESEMQTYQAQAAAAAQSADDFKGQLAVCPVSGSPAQLAAHHSWVGPAQCAAHAPSAWAQPATLHMVQTDARPAAILALTAAFLLHGGNFWYPLPVQAAPPEALQLPGRAPP